MTYSPFQAMQAAVDIVNSSTHATNKIAATLFGARADGEPFTISATNHWPNAIATKIGTTERIGGSSGTVHAETACILQAPVTLGAAICITDPFCPNCAKNIAEAGIKTIYIDHKGFEKDFALRRGDDFTTMSLRIVERAGIAVYSINRRGQTITPIITPATTYRAPEDRPVHLISPSVTTFDRNVMIDAALKFRPAEKDLPFAAAWTTGPDNRPKILITEAHVTVGYTEGSTADRLEMEEMHKEKYSFVMEPVNRLLMAASRLGLTIDHHMIISSRVPTSREQVNLVAANLPNLHILNAGDSRDVAAINALHQLTRAGVIALR